MKFTVEVFDFGVDDAISVRDDIINLFYEYGLIGKLSINDNTSITIGDKLFIKKAEKINKILKNRTPEHLKELFYDSNILIDVTYKDEEKELFGVFIDDEDPIDAITKALTDYDFEEVEPKPRLMDVKDGKIYSLTTGGLIKQFSICNGKIKLKNRRRR